MGRKCFYGRVRVRTPVKKTNKMPDNREIKEMIEKGRTFLIIFTCF